MKITLQINWRDILFSEQELVAIVEEHLLSKTPQKSTEDECFTVKPMAIDQKLFLKKKKDDKQELTRYFILDAFTEMNNNPKKYGQNFKTTVPKKTWDFKTVTQLKEMATKLGDHNADWVEMALEWAQRIANGESWESICNDDDTANWCRLVVWTNGYARVVGGSSDCEYDILNHIPASHFGKYDFKDGDYVHYAVPLVVSYKL